MKKLSLVFILSFILSGLNAGYSQNNQTDGNPFARYGTKVPVFTFSGGTEFHDSQRIVKIGSVKYDTRTHKVVGFIETNDTANCLPPEVTAMQPDPKAEKYYSISPYVYCLNNPVRFTDPDGRDVKDKIVGFGIGLLTNIIPGTGGLRDSYTPTDAPDYNNALRATDNAALVLGNGMINTGGGGIAAGGAMVVGGLTVTAASGGTAAIAGVPIAVVGETLAGAGAATTATGAVLMANGANNQSEGYDRGGVKVQSKTLWKGSDGHLDVENPAPGKRPGQIHYQDAKGNKYMYNAEKNSFYGKNNKTGEWDQNAPNSVNKRLNDDKFQNAINKGLNYLK